ncbi:MAG: tetratricopeptide repeat protein [Muribaculaceae bacterium]|nr:tetratricopeptide repeat protein [Muribaculaceae bacterium]
MKKYYSLLIVALISIIGVNIIASAPRNEAKGKYYRLKGMEQDVQGNLAEAYSLYRLAYEADPTNLQTGYYYARTSLFVADSAQRAKAFDMMRAFVDRYPAEYEDNLFYATVNVNIDHNNAEAMRVLKRLLTYKPDDEPLLEKIVELSMDAEEPDSVLYYVDRLNTLTGDESPYTQYVIAAYLAKGDTVGLIHHIDENIAQTPSNAYYYIIRGILAGLESDDPALAEKYYLMADSVSPNNFGVKHSLLSFYHEHGDSIKEQQTMYEALLCEDVDLEDKMNIFGQYATSQLYDNKSTEHTDTMINKLLEQYPYSTEIRSLAADYYYAKEDLPKAIENMEITVDMDPDNMEYRANYIQLLSADSRYADAARVYEQAVNYEHDNPVLDVTMTAIYNELKMPEKAEGVLDQISHTLMKNIGLDPNTDPLQMTDDQIQKYLNADGVKLLADILAERGNIYFNTKELDKAVEYYEKALALDNTDLFKNNYAYFLALNSVDMDKAHELSKSTIEANPDNPVYLDTYAYILFREGKYDEALEMITKAIEQAQTQETKLSADYYEHYGDILYKCGKSTEALEQWRKALQLEPDNSRIAKKVKAKKYIDEE